MKMPNDNYQLLEISNLSSVTFRQLLFSVDCILPLEAIFRELLVIGQS